MIMHLTACSAQQDTMAQLSSQPAYAQNRRLTEPGRVCGASLLLGMPTLKLPVEPQAIAQHSRHMARAAEPLKSRRPKWAVPVATRGAC